MSAGSFIKLNKNIYDNDTTRKVGRPPVGWGVGILGEKVRDWEIVQQENGSLSKIGAGPFKLKTYAREPICEEEDWAISVVDRANNAPQRGVSLKEMCNCW